MTSATRRGRAVCTCDKGCTSQDEMTRRHGTPAQFSRGVRNAIGHDITWDEAELAIRKYEREWCAAGRR